MVDLRELNRLEDYLQMRGYNYARIDLNTPKEWRDIYGKSVFDRHQIIVFEGIDCLSGGTDILRTPWSWDATANENGLIDFHWRVNPEHFQDSLASSLTSEAIIRHLERVN